MEITKIFITVATIVFTLLSFTLPLPTVYYWGYRGICIVLAIIGWLIVYRLWF